MTRRIPWTAAAAVLLLLLLPVSVLADGPPPPQPTLALPGVQVWALLAGAAAPLLTYVLNHYAPWASEPVKAGALIAASAAAGAVAQLIDTGSFAVNMRTLEVVMTAVIAALFAHKALWLPAGISTRLGGGTNSRDPTPAT